MYNKIDATDINHSKLVLTYGNFDEAIVHANLLETENKHIVCTL